MERPNQPNPDEIRDALAGVLGDAQVLGFLGPGPLEQHVTRALDLALALSDAPARALDLGTGAGVPGLPLALLWDRSRWVLLDGSTRRAAFLEGAVQQLGLSGRVEVRAAHAETAARTDLRGTFDAVVARGFATPAATAECGAPFLCEGGSMVVAEPPGGEPGRWDANGLDELGMRLGKSLDSPTACQVLIQVISCPERYPRRVGIPVKRPLW